LLLSNGINKTYAFSFPSLSKLDSSDEAELYLLREDFLLGDGFLLLLAAAVCFPGRLLGGALDLTGSESESEESLFHVLELKV